jgi:hypothetical protein
MNRDQMKTVHIIERYVDVNLNRPITLVRFLV